ncbi:MAG: ABC transporter permease [Candidatus Acidiferrales bacterium]
MIGYITRRVVHVVFLLIGVSVLSFFFLQLAPGNYFDDMRLNPAISPGSIVALKAQYGVDKSLPVRYARWLSSVLHGDMGYSFAYNRPVARLLWARAENTLLLTIPATLVAWLIAIPLGVWMASHRGGYTDRFASAGIAGVVTIPDVIIALGLLLFAVHTHWFPVGGMLSLNSETMGFGKRLINLGSHLALPIAALVLGMLPFLVRHVRSSVSDALDAAFVRNARAHGISNGRIVFRYALPAAANPLISLFGFSIGVLLSASLLIEVVMSWPGLGPFLLEAIMARDFYVVIGVVMLSSVLLSIGTLLSDVLLFSIDPRIRMRGLL